MDSYVACNTVTGVMQLISDHVLTPSSTRACLVLSWSGENYRWYYGRDIQQVKPAFEGIPYYYKGIARLSTALRTGRGDGVKVLRITSLIRTG